MDPISGVMGALGKGGAGGIGGTGFDTGAKQIPVLQDTKTVGGASFEDTLKQFVNHVSDQQDVSADYIGRFTRGEPVELHQVMAAAEEASISLDMLVEVRNKFLDAYHSVISMQS
jgi:flagellar hook-basal body complex protein FliE